MTFKDYYSILEIGRFASFEEIKAAYRAMSKKWHPDMNPNVDVKHKMQDINEAYAILKDYSKKQGTTENTMHIMLKIGISIRIQKPHRHQVIPMHIPSMMKS